MKKVFFLLIVLAAVSPVFAQQNNAGVNVESNLYYFNVRVERVYPSGEGYIIQYQRSNGLIATIGIPMEWFGAAGKGELLLLPAGKNWPTMSIFYDAGEFSHVRLYIHRSKGHATWGVVPQGTNLSRFFSEDRESFNFLF